jgi:hypothetical protein
MTGADARSGRPWWRQRAGFEDLFRRRPPHAVFWGAFDAYIVLVVAGVGSRVLGYDGEPWLPFAAFAVAGATFAFVVRRERARGSLIAGGLTLMWLGFGLGADAGETIVVVDGPTADAMPSACLGLPGARSASRELERVPAPPAIVFEVRGFDRGRALAECLVENGYTHSRVMGP